jgi:hypothetical protein
MEKIKNLKKPAKYFYLKFLDDIITKPEKAEEKWNALIAERISDEAWNNIYYASLIITCKFPFRELPLATYVYSKRRDVIDKLINKTNSGALLANDCLVHGACMLNLIVYRNTLANAIALCSAI